MTDPHILFADCFSEQTVWCQGNTQIELLPVIIQQRALFKIRHVICHITYAQHCKQFKQHAGGVGWGSGWGGVAGGVG